MFNTILPEVSTKRPTKPTDDGDSSPNLQMSNQSERSWLFWLSLLTVDAAGIFKIDRYNVGNKHHFSY